MVKHTCRNCSHRKTKLESAIRGKTSIVISYCYITKVEISDRALELETPCTNWKDKK